MRTVLATLLSSIFVITLTGCALWTLTPAAPAHDPTRVACEAFRLITWAPGSEDQALAFLEGVRAGTRPINRETLTVLRDVLGDTSTTVGEIKPHNAAYRALCTKPLPASESADLAAALRSVADRPISN